jgi:hypothetical protein
MPLQIAIHPPARAKPALMHFAASAALALVVGVAVFLLWFPGDYRIFSGGTELFELVVGVDLVLGPLVTFLISSPRKPFKVLLGDIAVIAALQLAALGYGLHMVSISRPVVMALEVDRFRVVPASGVYMKELTSAPLPEMRSLSLTGPRLVRSVMPSDATGKNQTLDLGLSGYDIGTRPSLWRPWDAAARTEALAHAKPLGDLTRRYPARRAELDRRVAATGRDAWALVWLPMITFRGDWVALLDAGSGDVVGYAPFDGF